MVDLTQPQTLPDLPYDFNALEPVISGEIMKLHWDKHHRAYVNNLNAALEKQQDAIKKGELSNLIQLQQAIKFNGGGHINHSIFWTNLAPINAGGGIAPTGALADAIKQTYGSLESLIEAFSAKLGTIQGSGWGWLGYDKTRNRLELTTCANQDPLQATTGLVPLLGIDVWEHAFYLQYKNARPDYIKAIWQVVNWKNVSERYDASYGK